MQALGELAAGLAHEIRNPLNAIGTSIQQLRTDFRPATDTDDYEQLTAIIHEEVRRVNEAVQGFLLAVRPEPLRAELFDLKDFIEALRTEYAAMLSERAVRLQVKYEWHGEVQWDRRQMHQALMNLIQNAVDAMPREGELIIAVRQPDPGVVEIHVTDDGDGIPADIRDRIFNLYFTTKADGTGIGLSLVQRIVQDHAGTVAVESRPGETTFTLRLPQWHTRRREA
jgi:signal transduction histidine kinase